MSILMGCSEENPVPETSNYLKIQTSIPETRALKTAFAANDEMAIYVKSSASLTAGWYNEVTGVSKATYSGSAWTLNPNVMLNANAAYVYAYFPYSSLVTDPEAVPVSTAAQLDYLYSGLPNTASSTNNNLALSMSHAQSNFRFNIIDLGYSGVGLLKYIRIANKGDKAVLYTQGTLNISSGIVTGKHGANQAYTIADINKTIQVGNGWETGLPSAMVIPFTPAAQGDVEFIFQIDDKTFTIDCPVQADGYARGQQYTFNLKLSGRNLVLNQNDITIEPWGDNSVDLGDVVARGNSVIYSLTTQTASQTVTLPALNVSDAEVAFGDGQTAPYAPNLQHTYAAPGPYQVIINSEAPLTTATFQMSSVTEIDLSGMNPK